MRKKSQNYLEFIPEKAEGLTYAVGENNIVTLEVENKGVFNRLFQLILKKPKISYIHLDDLGSFIWCHINGNNSVFEIAEMVKKSYGDNAEPLYERIIKYFEILKNYKFIVFINE